MMDYYNIIRIGQLFSRPLYLKNVSYTGTAYYNQIVDTIRKCVHVPNFPNINSKNMYMYLMPIEKPKIEEMYDSSLFKWKSMWKNITFKYIQVNERELIFKYMHEILPTMKRLRIIQMGHMSSDCKFCGAEESNIHFTYQCSYYKPVIEWFKQLLIKCCNFNPISMIKILMFDIENVNIKENNTCIILVATYIYNMWMARKTELTPMTAIKLIKNKILYNKCIIKYSLKNNFKLVFTDSYQKLKYGNM